MKIKFKEQEFQKKAIKSVINLFKGQDKQDYREIYENDDMQMNFISNEISFNHISISNKQILKNLNIVQDKNGLIDEKNTEEKTFCIEMETGTGKTFIYTKTIFELNKNYGFKKFIIVVPSIAIKQGVFKSFQIMKDELKKYNENYNVFIYDSSKLEQVRRFAISNNIEIMIINIDAFKKDENIINQENDRLSRPPIEYIQKTNPIVIIDEPQSVDNTEKSKKAINSLNPAAIFKYSATHREKVNLVYSLNSVQAFQKGIVKQIIVASVYSPENFNTPYIKLLKVDMDNGKTGGINFRATLELDILEKNGKIKRTKKILKQNDDLKQITGREEYDGYIITNIDCEENNKHIEFNNTKILYEGKAIGDIDEDLIKKEQIRRTIKEHLEKEKEHTDKGIKVLSLFFIDRVDKYRLDDGGKGIYAKMFEECYNELINKDRYKILKEKFNYPIEKIHNGYFSKDKKGNLKNTKGDSSMDDNTYKTIMQDKEYLLSFECPLRFIFSHSALKEGWDNPNVFQVCTLIDQKSKFSARQKIGRGLRLCVNQNGERVEDKNINILHIIANESFEDFAKNLQKEIEDETGIKFGTVEMIMFKGISYEVSVIKQENIKENEAEELNAYLKNEGYIDENGNINLKKAKEDNFFNIPEKFECIEKELKKLFIEQKIEKIDIEVLKKVTYEKTIKDIITTTTEDARKIFEHFKDINYINDQSQITTTMKNDIDNNILKLPKEYRPAKDAIIKKLEDIKLLINIKDANDKVTVKLNKLVFSEDKFKGLWERIKYKTEYEIKLDEKAYKEECIKRLRKMPKIDKIAIEIKMANINIEKARITSEELQEKRDSTKIEYKKYNVTLEHIKKIAIKTRTLPKLVLDILVESGKLNEIYNDPKRFSEQVIDVFKNVQAKVIINNIKYKTNNKEYSIIEVFNKDEIIVYKNALKLQNNKSPYDYVIYDSKTVEKPFAKKLDEDDKVKMFFKLPSSFKIDTPIGSYNPDWAIYREEDNKEKLYFVIETKGSIDEDDLRGKEDMKIKCGKAHFKALQTNVEFSVKNKYPW